MSFWRKGGKKKAKHALPVYSVDTEKEAQSLLVLVCKRSYDGRDYVYPLPADQTEALAALPEVSRALDAGYKRILAARAFEGGGHGGA